MKKFECNVTYEAPDEKNPDKIKKVTKTYLTSGETFGDAEDKILTYVAREYDVAPQVVSEKVVTFTDILEPGSDLPSWYNIKAVMIDETEDGKEVKINDNFLVPATSANDALLKATKYFEGLMLDYDITLIRKTKITEVYL